MALFGSVLGSVLAPTAANLVSGLASGIPGAAELKSGVASASNLAGALAGANVVDSVTIMPPSGKAAGADVDMRVRLRAQGNREDDIYGAAGSDNVLSILHDTKGVVFPYTPVVNFSQDVDYKNIDLVHTNYDFNAYTRTPSASISLSGKFTVQSQLEGKYAVAVLHFFRAISKMHFGDEDAKDGLAGLPPPTLLLSGYGTYMFNDLRVIVKGHNYTFDDTVDMVTVKTDDGYVTRLPSVFTLSVTLGIQKAPAETRKYFNLDSFRKGELMRKGGWI